MFLPTTNKEVTALGWDYIDVILFSGDAYVDHPAFGIAVIARVLESIGLRVAVVPQPNWRDDLRDFKKLGTPRLFFGVSAGAMDSMVNHYTSTKRIRSNDAYTPGGIAGQRPDYALKVYSEIIKSLYPHTPLVVGGIEASLRRFSHYDYWQNTVLPSMLQQTKADLLVYGMGEKPMKQIALELQKGTSVSDIRGVPQTMYACGVIPQDLGEHILLHSFEECKKSKTAYAENFVQIEQQSNAWKAQSIVQKSNNEYIIAVPPSQGPAMDTKELDFVYDLPFTRQPHPRYKKKKPIPAYEMIRDSVTIHRGCFGACSFCTISAHQGKFVTSRSEQSVINELKKVQGTPGFKGHVTDLGGPSANMYNMKGKDLRMCMACKRPSCIFPNVCNNLHTSHEALTALYQKASEVKGIKHITIGSGVRLDLLQGSKGERAYLKRLVSKHISGRLKVAPEHTQNSVLALMRKPSFDSFKKFKRSFEQMQQTTGQKQQLVPYFISAHPGCTKQDMAMLSRTFSEFGIRAEQVQDFTPTPMTLATTMYYTGIDPYTKKKVYVARSKSEKDEQKSFFFSRTKQR